MLRSKGSIGEYVLSVGANINNKIYIGASLGIQSVYQRKYIDYVEEYFYDAPSQNTPDFGNSGLDYQLLLEDDEELLLRYDELLLEVDILFREDEFCRE